MEEENKKKRAVKKTVEKEENSTPKNNKEQTPKKRSNGAKKKESTKETGKKENPSKVNTSQEKKTTKVAKEEKPKKETPLAEEKTQVKANEEKKEKKIEKKEPEVIEVIVEKPSGFNVLEVVIIMFITLCFGGLLGSALTYAVANKNEIITSIPSELKEFVNTYNNIKEEYYEEVDEKKLLDAGIKGMIGYLGDKYSVYMDQETSEEFNEKVEGEYVGIGSEIRRMTDGTTIISNPFENGPAQKAGLQVGDVILKINGVEIGDKTLQQISSEVKGKAGTSVLITVKRGEEELEVTVIRENVEISSVYHKTYLENEKKIGYIRIDIFAANTTKQFEQALLELEKEEIQALAIDVRNNSGGYLSTVKDIASLFLKKGDNIYQLDTKGNIEIIKDNTNASRTYPVAVIINQASASASEILASAIKESYVGGEVVGVHSYGKGTVQKAYDLSSGVTVKYTIQKWLTPNGNWIHETGVTPTKEVTLDSIYYENPVEENDNQLKEAIKLLGEKE